MILLRLVFILTALIVVLSGGMYVFTQDRRHLRFIKQVVRFAVYLALVFVVLFLMERYGLVAWGVLV